MEQTDRTILTILRQIGAYVLKTRFPELLLAFAERLVCAGRCRRRLTASPRSTATSFTRIAPMFATPSTRPTRCPRPCRRSRPFASKSALSWPAPSRSVDVRLPGCDSWLKCLQGLGWTGKLGYEAFMYPNVKDMRSILMFTVEKLPRTDKAEEEDEVLGPCCVRSSPSLLMQPVFRWRCSTEPQHPVEPAFVGGYPVLAPDGAGRPAQTRLDRHRLDPVGQGSCRCVHACVRAFRTLSRMLRCLRQHLCPMCLSVLQSRSSSSRASSSTCTSSRRCARSSPPRCSKPTPRTSP